MRAEERSILKSFVPAIIFTALLWIVKGIEIYYNLDFARYGIYPRDFSSVTGLFTMPFIHGDLKHIFSNTIPLVILGACLVYFYNDLWKKVFLQIWLLHAVWLWIGGREAWHIGASGIVYGLASFILLSGILRRERRLMALSLIVVFLYGGMVWGFFPLFIGISWEAHLFGAIAGALLAWAYRKEGPQRVPFAWENEDDDPNDTSYLDDQKDDAVEGEEIKTSADPLQPPTIVYHYPKE